MNKCICIYVYNNYMTIYHKSMVQIKKPRFFPLEFQAGKPPSLPGRTSGPRSERMDSSWKRRGHEYLVSDFWMVQPPSCFGLMYFPFCKTWIVYSGLGGGFKDVFIFTPKIGEDSHFDSYF